MKDAIKKADTLIEALPYIKKFHKKVFVIKYGGSILSEEKVRKCVLEDIAFLRYSGILPVLVHGGGPNITGELKKLKIQSEFVDGIRVTDEATLKVVKEELHELNDLIVKDINFYGPLSKGLKLEDKLLKVVKKVGKKDLGFVGDVIDYDKAKLEAVLEKMIPVIAPLGISSDGLSYNINADDVAFFLAAKLKAEKLVLLTNVAGVMRDPQNPDSLISTINSSAIEELIKEKVIEEGMIPKVTAAVGAIGQGVGKAHIISAKIPHALLLEIFTNEGIGTEIVK